MCGNSVGVLRSATKTEPSELQLGGRVELIFCNRLASECVLGDVVLDNWAF